MTARVLPIEHWDTMPESLDHILAGLLPGRSQVIVVEEAGEIVGHLLLFPVLHAECLWIDPKKQKKASVLRHLLKAMARGAQTLGFDRVWGASASDDMTDILMHPRLRGIPIPALSVVLPCERTD